MPDERLEFSAEDLGRLARSIGADTHAFTVWLVHGTNSEDVRRVRRAFYDGYNEDPR